MEQYNKMIFLKGILFFFMLIAFASGFLIPLGNGGERSSIFAQEKKRFAYIGSFTCKKCHHQHSGVQYGDWLQSKHYNAYRALLYDSKRLSAVMEQYQIQNPQRDERCLRCHSTGRGKKFVINHVNGRDFSGYEGVGCESCHGPASRYIDPQIHIGTGNVSTSRVAKKVQAGMWSILGDSGISLREKMCMRCHTKQRMCRLKGYPFIDISMPVIANFKHRF